MTCYVPLSAWRTVSGDFKGKIQFSQQFSSGPFIEHLILPCGRCIGCRLERSRQWAVRCMHEASLHEDNCFITLTYDNEHLPKDGSLKLEHYQKFMKRFRKMTNGGVRFFHCGEYGDKTNRPHYHACIFGFDFKDKYLWKVHNEQRYYRSPSLEKLWFYGNSIIGDVTFDSAAYVARYILKKVNGDAADEHYSRVCSDTGVSYQLKPEYITMSRNPGIAFGWYDKFKSDVYPSDFLVVNGVKCKPPRYYDGLYEIDDKIGYAVLKEKRKVFASSQKNIDNNSSERLAVRHECKKRQVSSLVRPLD